MRFKYGYFVIFYIIYFYLATLVLNRCLGYISRKGTKISIDLLGMFCARYLFRNLELLLFSLISLDLSEHLPYSAAQ